MRKDLLNAKRSFTLMELLIVIAIIGVLGALIIPTINQARAKARDARRLQDLRTFQTVLELYYNDNQHYPIWEAGGGFQDQAASSTIAAALVPDYLSSLPKDPLIKKYVYYYKSDSTGSLYKGTAYLETSSDQEKIAAQDGGTASKYYEVFAYKGNEQIDFTGNPNDDDSDWLDKKMPYICGTGTGTQTDPYIICTLQQLQAMNNHLDWYYKLNNDIDASETSGWNGGAGFVPIGNSSNKFTGHFDGKGHKIANLYINRPSSNYIGLFGCVASGVTINNIGLVDIEVYGGQNTGGLAGSSDGSISDSYVIGNVNGSGATGGLVGYNNTGSITRSYSKGSVNGSGNSVGGLVGQTYSYSSISNSYSNSNVTGSESWTGGFVGYTWFMSIVNCYATGDVNGNAEVGNFVGFNGHSMGSITNSYGTGKVTGGSYVGGFAGTNSRDTCSNCFWDTQTSGRPSSGCGATGKTTAEMKAKNTFTNAGWDFCPEGTNKIWAIDDGSSYPCENWQYSTCACH